MARTAPIVVNKFAGKCDTCGTAVKAGAGVATKAADKWIVLCTKDAPETHGARNPWRGIHMSGEMDYTGGEYTRSKARQLVNNEYRDTDALAEKCECGGTMWWRATVGARICPDCNTMVVYRHIKGTNDFERKIVKL